MSSPEPDRRRKPRVEGTFTRIEDVTYRALREMEQADATHVAGAATHLYAAPA